MAKTLKPTSPSFPALVQRFFSQYLVEQRALSPRTLAAYRDSFLLFLAFAKQRLGKSPASMNMADITPRAHLGLPGAFGA
jgi:site-specific recombinase XerD